MWLHTLLASWKSGSSRKQRRQPRLARRGPRLTREQLEDRIVPSNYFAASVSDLIADVSAANTAGGSNTITLTAPTTSPYDLAAVDNTTDGATGLPVIATNDTLTIVGNGDTIERSTASGTAAFRLCDVAAGASLTLQNLTLQGGLATGLRVAAEGGAIYNQGALTLSGATVQNNIAQGANYTSAAAGGGIYSNGALTLDGGTTVQNNKAQGGNAPVELGRPPFPGSNGLGGGLYVAGGTAALSNATLASNTAQGGQGSSVSNERGGTGGNGFGGALEVAAGTVTLSSVTLSSNTAQGGQGGSAYALNSYYGSTGGKGFGGALQVSGGTVNVVSSTLSANTAQGGPGGSISRISPGYHSSGGTGFGGGLEAAGGTVTLSSDTLSTNAARGGAGTGVFLGLGGGGGLSIASGAPVSLDAFTLANVINNTAVTNPNIDGPYTLSLPDTTAGTSYSSTLSSPLTGTVTFSTTAGTLPTGLTLSSGGVLSGTPTSAGTYSFTVTATDTAGGTASQIYAVTINPAITLTTSLPSGSVGAAYSQTIGASGGTGALTLSSTGIVPPGLTLSGTGVLAGTPSASGSFPFTVTATDTVGASASQSYTVTIFPLTLEGTLSNWTINQPGYNQTITASGGTAPYTFTTTSGTLPTGLTLNNNGVLAGTPTTAGSFNFTVMASDSTSANGIQNYTITINPALAITTTMLPSWTVNQPGYGQGGLAGAGLIMNGGFETPVSPSGGFTTVYAGDNSTMAPWVVSSGSVDVVNNGFWSAYQGSNSLDLAGSTLNGGQIAQTIPTSAGATYLLTFAYANNTYVDSADVLVTGKGTLLHTSVTHSGSTFANMNYVLFSQSFVADSSSATLQFTETNNYLGGNDGNHGIVLDAVSVNPVPETGTLSVSGGTGSTTFATTSGTLPPGLTLSAAGVLSGTPTASGSFTFTVTATDAVGAPASESYTVTINPAVSITTIPLANGTVDQAGYSQTISATGGTGSLAFSVTGTLPPGLSLSSAGVLAGTPTMAGSYSFVVTATDTVGASGSASFPVTINGAMVTQLVITNLSPTGVSVGDSVTFTLTAEDSAGQVVGGYSGTVQLTSTDSSATIQGAPVPSSYTFMGSDAGAHTFTVVLQTSGSQTITATDQANGSLTATTNPIAVNPIAPNHGPYVVSIDGSNPTNLVTNVSTVTYTVTFSKPVTGVDASAFQTATTGTVMTAMVQVMPVSGAVYTVTVSGITGSGTLGLNLVDSGSIHDSAGKPLVQENGLASFAAQQTFDSGTGPEFVAVADVNGDGKRDLIVANAGADDVSVLLGNGDGTFQSAMTFATGMHPDSVAVADLNGDGKLDLVTANYNSDTVSVLLGNGDGTFQTQQTFATGTGPRSVVVADVNGDGKPDVIVTNFNGGHPGSVSVLLGNGDGTFQPQKTFATGGEPSSVAVADLNGDGKPDLVVANEGTPSTPGNVSVLLGNGDGTFQNQVTFSTGQAPFAVAVADLNGDGKPDVITANYADNTVSVLLGNGDGTFQAQQTFATGGAPQSVVVADINGDGKPDLVASNYGDNTVSVLLGNGDGTFQDQTTLATGTQPYAVTVADLNGDGRPDLVTANYGDNNVSVLLNSENGNFTGQRYTIEPPITIAPSLSSGSVGTAYNQTISASGGIGALTFSSTGTVPPGLTLSSSGVLSGTPSTSGSFTFMVTATDTVGASASQAYTLAISPGVAVKYLVAIQGSSTVQAGSSFLVSVQAADLFGNPVTSYSGPTSATATISPTIAASNFPLTVPINSSGLGLFLANLQKVGTYTITVAGGSFTGSAGPVTVMPGPAVKLAFGVQPVSTPTGVTLPAVSVQVQDLYGNAIATDNTDTVTVDIATGPGSFAAGSTTTANVMSGVATFTNLTLTTLGSYTLSAQVPTRYTGPNSTSFTVTPLQVLPGTFASSPSGFSVALDAPFLVDSVTPSLYGSGFGATATVTPTVTLSGPSGPVEGSMVINRASNTLTFVETNTASAVNNGTPILPDGTYVAKILASGPNGLQALGSGGGYLDGTNSGTPGHDWTAAFTIGATAAGDDIVWVPATADGPGQTLSAPGHNQIGGGYPIYLSDRTGMVTNVQLTLNYDPALLTVSGVTGTDFALLSTSTPGHAVLQYGGPALPVGTQTPIGFVTAHVPAGTSASPIPYRARDLLHLSSVSLNGGTGPVATGDALHLVAYVGDADGNGSYSGNDAVLITRVSLQADTGFAAYPLVDPVIVADTDGAGFLPADAPFQANDAAIGLPTANLPVPPTPSGVVFQPIANNVDPTVSIPATLHVAADGTLTVPVTIDDAHPEGSSGLTAGHLALTYDPRLFTVSATDVHLGSLLAAGSGWTVTPTINPVTGDIAIALSSTTPITSTVGGSLVTIDFHLSEGVRGEGSGVSAAPSRLAAIQLVAWVNPSGQQVVLTELEDAQGMFTLTPAPSSGSSLQVGSVVLLTAPPEATPNTPVGEPAPVNTLAPVETLATHSPPGDASVREPATSTSSAAVAEPNEPNFSAGPSAVGDPATVHVGAAGAHTANTVVSLASGTVAPLNTTSLLSLGFQFAALPSTSPTGAGSVAAQHLADQWFQALARETGSAMDPALVIGNARDTFERALANQLRSAPFATDNLDDLFPNEGAGDLAAKEQAALEQYFADTADDTDSRTEGE